MNRDAPAKDGSLLFYDGDYPSVEMAERPGYDPTLPDRQMIRHDVDFYRRVAGLCAPGRVLEIGCGTGRITLPLARDGRTVIAVDVNAAMLARLRAALTTEDAAVASRVQPLQADARDLAIGRSDVACILVSFNTFMLVGDFRDQCRTLEAFAAHLPSGGYLAFDVMNPLVLPLGETTAETPEIRRDPRTGHLYRKFARTARIDEGQCQRLFGWYEESVDGGRVRRYPYAFVWRPVFRFELTLMLERAGFIVESLAGGFRGEAFAVDSPKMVVTARKA